MEEIPRQLQADWISAFREEDGYRLMILLRREPRLVTVKHRRCSVLHLAMRNNWYGLAQEILQKFNHLHNESSPISGASSSSSSLKAANVEQDLHIDTSSLFRGSSTSSEAADPRQDTGDLKSSPSGDYGSKVGTGSALDLATFRDLLVAKEGFLGAKKEGRKKATAKQRDGESSIEDTEPLSAIPKASGFDVFAMALIQGHQATNKILVEAVSKVDRLFDKGHPYKDLIRRAEWVDSPGDSDPHEKERQLLREIMADCFTEASLRVQQQRDKFHVNLPVSSNSSFSATEEGEVAADSHDQVIIPGSCSLRANPKVDRLEDEMDPAWREQWELTSPFLRFEEFVFLACCLHPSGFLADPYKYYEVRCAGELVLERCAQLKGDKPFINYILSINDTWGSAIHHALLSEQRDFYYDRSSYGRMLELVLGMIPDELSSYVNKRDSLGRTPLHMALALGLRRGISLLLKNKETTSFATENNCVGLKFAHWEIDVNTVSQMNGYMPYKVPGAMYRRTPFHLAIRSPHLRQPEREEVVRQLADMPEGERRGLNEGGICPTVQSGILLTPLQLAAYVGDLAVVQILANDHRAYDPARLTNSSKEPPKFSYLKYSALHIAALAAHPHVIRSILATEKFSPLVQDEKGNTALHLALNFELPEQFPHVLADFCQIPFTRSGTPYKPEKEVSAKEQREQVRMAESKRQSCISLLLQGGTDVLLANSLKQLADPGPKASPEYTLWWYDKLSRETQEAKQSSSLTANAVSVTGALVATASYAGPLQPPLGYAAHSESLIEKMQVGVPSVRIFIVCNTLAFYLALAAIVLSLTPSLPIRQELLVDELTLLRWTVTLSVALLLVSITAVLLAFASASIAVIPDEGSWNHGGLTVSTLCVGGFICFLALFWSVYRLQGLALHRRKLGRKLPSVCM